MEVYAPTHRLPRWKRALFITMIFALALGFAEVAARAVNAWTYVSVDELRTVYKQRRDWRLGKSWPLQRGDYPYLPYVPNPEHPEVNELGFHGKSFPREKTPNAYRIFCLGGSTTWNGYPKYLEEELRDDFAHHGLDLTVINAGNQCWTSLESLINFITRCLPLGPDAIVVYHGVNDVAFAFGETISPDYTHLRRRFEKDDPLMWDYLPAILDHSAAFVEFRAIFERKVGTRGIRIVVRKDVASSTPLPYHGLAPYRENLSTLFSICRARGIDVFLCTQVFNRDAGHKFSFQNRWADAVDDANGIIRSFSEHWADVHVIDVAAALPGNNDWMTDYCHFTEDGKVTLARFIAAALRPHTASLALKRRGSRPKPATSVTDAARPNDSSRPHTPLLERLSRSKRDHTRND